MARTLVDQAYLIPLSIDLKPVYWTHQNGLMLYPQPDLVRIRLTQLILADKHHSYIENYMGCTVVNPSSFPNSDFQFMTYQSSTNECDYSRIE